MSQFRGDVSVELDRERYHIARRDLVAETPNSERLVTTGNNVEYLQLTTIIDGDLDTHEIEGDDRVLFTTNAPVYESHVEDDVPAASPGRSDGEAVPDS